MSESVRDADRDALREYARLPLRDSVGSEEAEVVGLPDGEGLGEMVGDAAGLVLGVQDGVSEVAGRAFLSEREARSRGRAWRLNRTAVKEPLI